MLHMQDRIMGAGKVDRIKKGLNVSIGVTAVYSIVIMVVAFFWLPSFVKIFVADPTGELRAIAEQMFHISLWFYFPLGLIFLYRNTLQGIGNGLVPMLGGVFELLARGLAVFLLFKPLRVYRNLYLLSGSMGKCIDSAYTVLLLVYAKTDDKREKISEYTYAFFTEGIYKFYCSVIYFYNKTSEE